jgi:cytochrome P450
MPSVFNAADNGLYSWRRKIISQGFSEQAIRASEPKILKHVADYCDVLFGSATLDEWSKPHKTTQWSAFFATDFIADLTVGRSTAMLTSPENRVYNPPRKANFARMGLGIQWPEAFSSGGVSPVKIGELLFSRITKLGKQWHEMLRGIVWARRWRLTRF